MNNKLKYREQYRFWTDKKVSQLSFHNNLLLTLGLAMLGYWSKNNSVFSNLVINCEADIEWSIVIFILGFASIIVSIVAGFILSLSRLYDLRLTSNISLTKMRAADESIELELNDPIKPSCKDSIKSPTESPIEILFDVSWNYKYYKISKNEIKNTDEFHKKLAAARQKASNLGHLTWQLVQWQTLSMLIGVILFIVTLFIK